MIIYVLGCNPKTAAIIAQKMGLRQGFDLKPIARTLGNECSGKAISHSINMGEVAGVISATFVTWNPIGPAIVRHCQSKGIPTVETYNQNLNWPRAFRELKDKLPKAFQEMKDIPLTKPKTGSLISFAECSQPPEN